MSIETVPTGLLQIIFSFTTWREQQTIGMVCRRWATAVEPLLLARTRLIVSSRIPFTYEQSLLDPRMRLIDRKLVTNSNRNYTCLRVEWEDESTGLGNTMLQEALDVCQQRFSVRILYLKGPIGNFLTDLLHKYRKWLENLIQLHFEEISNSEDHLDQGSAKIELSLPKLKKLTWVECMRHLTSIRDVTLPFYPANTTPRASRFYEMHATLDVPELERLKIRVERKDEITRFYLHQEYANNCYLFQPNLYLKSCSNLQHIDILQLNYLGQSLVNLSEPFLQNLKTLTMFHCEYPSIKMICEKCSGLDELSIDEPLYHDVFLSSVALAPSLKKLTLNKFKAPFMPQVAEFPELRCLSLTHMTNSLDSNRVSLVAPNLATLIISVPACDWLKIVHKDQIRTMVVDAKFSNHPHSSPPPANITELTLYQRELPYGAITETLLQDYLNLHSNLKRLTLFGPRPYRNKIQLGLKHFLNLEYLCVHQLAFRLSDLHELTQLKSLLLSFCQIITTPSDGDVKLCSLEHLLMEHVTFKNLVHGKFEARYWDHFPIYGSGRGTLVANRGGVFRTPNFHLLDDVHEDM